MILVLGGTKSGKTGFAEQTAEDYARKKGTPVVYLATARAWDQEMEIRIQNHKESRPSHWVTVEEPLDIKSVFHNPRVPAESVILFDCLTMWITNLMMELGEDFTKEEAELHIMGNLERFLAHAEKFSGEIIIISNLVEVGLISPSFMGRTFQDAAGMAHQKIASLSRKVFQITAGIPVQLK